MEIVLWQIIKIASERGVRSPQPLPRCAEQLEERAADKVLGRGPKGTQRCPRPAHEPAALCSGPRTTAWSRPCQASSSAVRPATGPLPRQEDSGSPDECPSAVPHGPLQASLSEVCRPAAAAASGNVLEKQILGPPPELLTQSLGGGTQKSVFNEPPRS